MYQVETFCYFRRVLIESRANRDKAKDSKRDRLQPSQSIIYQRVPALRWNVPGQVEGQDKGQAKRKQERKSTNKLTNDILVQLIEYSFVMRLYNRYATNEATNNQPTNG